MRMPLIDFLTNGDLKFVITLVTFFGISVYYFFQKIKNKENQNLYNQKINKLVAWSLMISVFSLLLGLLHSFYFISKASGIGNHLLFAGLANVIITPTLGVVVAMLNKLLATPIKLEKHD